MRYELRRAPPPLTEKEDILNAVKLAANYVQLGDPDCLKSAGCILDDLILHIDKPELQISIAKTTE